MELTAYIQDIKLKLGGALLELELDDSQIGQIVNSAFIELQGYIDLTKFITVDYSSCLDLSKIEQTYGVRISNVRRIFRASSYSNGTSALQSADPRYLQYVTMTSGTGMVGNITMLSNWVNNYSNYMTYQQMKNTTSTDLMFIVNKLDNKVYINCLDTPQYITLEYTPRFDNVDELTDDFWINYLLRLSLAHTKIILGRIRTYATSSNTIWELDGDKMLEEGNAELEKIREELTKSNLLITGID